MSGFRCGSLTQSANHDVEYNPLLQFRNHLTLTLIRVFLPVINTSFETVRTT